MNGKKVWGDRGEALTAEYLAAKGFRISARNYRSRFGEIDIIAENGVLLLFVEVKLRGERSRARPMESVTYQKREKIRATALCYIGETGTPLQPRFDVAEVFSENGRLSLRYVENAFGAED